MKTRFLFLVQRRGGGTLFNRLLAQKDDSRAGLNNQRLHLEPQKLPTQEDVSCCLLYSGVHDILKAGRFIYVPQSGKHGTPGPSILAKDRWAFCNYAEEGFPSWASPYLQKSNSLNEWEIFILVRDGRNHVTSLARGDGESKILSQCGRGFSEEEIQSHVYLQDIEHFSALCKRWQRKARAYLDAANASHNCRLVKFEDLVADPVGFMERVLLDCGLTPRFTEGLTYDFNGSSSWRETDIQGTVGKQQPQGIQLERYHIWTDQHYDLCYRIMSTELKELGYTGRGVDYK